jgi:serine acetyltransferase
LATTSGYAAQGASSNTIALGPAAAQIAVNRSAQTRWVLQRQLRASVQNPTLFSNFVVITSEVVVAVGLTYDHEHCAVIARNTRIANDPAMFTTNVPGDLAPTALVTQIRM